MCWGDDNDEDSQRFKNYVFFRFWGTDKEMDEAAPFIITIILLIIAGFIIWAVFFSQPPPVTPTP
jgi:hypothetical protein